MSLICVARLMSPGSCARPSSICLAKVEGPPFLPDIKSIRLRFKSTLSVESLREGSSVDWDSDPESDWMMTAVGGGTAGPVAVAVAGVPLPLPLPRMLTTFLRSTVSMWSLRKENFSHTHLSVADRSSTVSAPSPDFPTVFLRRLIWVRLDL